MFDFFVVGWGCFGSGFRKIFELWFTVSFHVGDGLPRSSK
jgi:hypothetical protein